MSRPRLQALPYHADASVYFTQIQDLPWPVWLDSGWPAACSGRYDIVLADPIETLELSAMQAAQLAGHLRSPLTQNKEVDRALQDVPFYGGWVGYLGYELGRAWAGLAPRKRPGLVADMRAGLYDWAIVVDHHRQTTVLASMVYAQQTQQHWEDLCTRLSNLVVDDTLPPLASGKLVDAGLSANAYGEAFQRIQHYLHEGDAYQVNITQRFVGHSEADSYLLYRYLRQLSPVPYGAYLGFSDYQILSNSPEQFVGLHAGKVVTRPIKGTCPRGTTPQQDARLRASLIASTKDRAENLMIVDLLRNDLGRVCRPGSIEVPELFRVESYAAVHHLVSSVCGVIQPDKDAVDLLQACFPGGSITGAPKLRAMQIIDELEVHSRELYCGSIFRLGFNGSLDSSISIRTILRRDHELYYWAGGGIVADSQSRAEYQESLGKSTVFFRLLQGG